MLGNPAENFASSSTAFRRVTSFRGDAYIGNKLRPAIRSLVGGHVIFDAYVNVSLPERCRNSVVVVTITGHRSHLLFSSNGVCWIG